MPWTGRDGTPSPAMASSAAAFLLPEQMAMQAAGRERDEPSPNPRRAATTARTHAHAATACRIAARARQPAAHHQPAPHCKAGSQGCASEERSKAKEKAPVKAARIGRSPSPTRQLSLDPALPPCARVPNLPHIYSPIPYARCRWYLRVRLSAPPTQLVPGWPPRPWLPCPPLPPVPCINTPRPLSITHIHSHLPLPSH